MSVFLRYAARTIVSRTTRVTATPRFIRYGYSVIPASIRLNSSARPKISPEEFIRFAEKLENDTPTQVPSKELAFAFIMECKNAWPAPASSLPPGWSTDWQSWPYLFTFYWVSPYYLMIPQAIMLLNIRHAIRGHPRPVMFRQPAESSSENPEFIFRVDGYNPGEQTVFYLCDCTTLELRRIEGIHDEEALLERMRSDAEVYSGTGVAHSLPLVHVPSDSDGVQVLERILERDETVIPLLAEKYLDFTPDPTTPEMEIPNIDLEWGSMTFDNASEGGGEEEIDQVRTNLRQLEQLTEWQRSLDNSEAVEVEEEGDEKDDVDSAELEQFMSVTDAVIEEGLQRQNEKVKGESLADSSQSEPKQQEKPVPDEEEIIIDPEAHNTILETIDRMKEIIADLEKEIQEQNSKNE